MTKYTVACSFSLVVLFSLFSSSSIFLFLLIFFHFNVRNEADSGSIVSHFLFFSSPFFYINLFFLFYIFVLFSFISSTLQIYSHSLYQSSLSTLLLIPQCRHRALNILHEASSSLWYLFLTRTLIIKSLGRPRWGRAISSLINNFLSLLASLSALPRFYILLSFRHQASESRFLYIPDTNWGNSFPSRQTDGKEREDTAVH